MNKLICFFKYLKEIFSETSNTIRSISIIDKNENIKIVKACHSFETEMSKSTDNFSRHGLACDIDLEEGIKKNKEIYEVYKKIGALK